MSDQSQGGVAILGPAGGGLHLINQGIIAGGLSQGGDERMDAVLFRENDGANKNILEIHAGSEIRGRVRASEGGADVLRLGGDRGEADPLVPDDTFDVGELSQYLTSPSALKYHGFDEYEKSGSSVWELTGAVQPTMSHVSWLVRAGALRITSDQALGVAGSTLTLDGGGIQIVDTAVALMRPVVLGDEGGVFDVLGGGTLRIQGSLSGDGGLTKAGPGTLWLSDSNKTYTGETRIEGGRIRFAGDERLGPNRTITFDGSGGSLFYERTLATATQDLNRDLVLNQDGELELSLGEGGESKQLVLKGTISGAGAFTVSGAHGRLVLAGEAQHTGGTKVKGAGGLQIGDGGSAGWLWGDVDVETGGVLAFSHDEAKTFGGLISGAGELRVNGSDLLTLTADNTLSGKTTVAPTAMLQLGKGAASGSVGGDIEVDTKLILFHGGDNSVRGAISGSGVVEKKGGGTVVLSGENTYTGGTRVAGGWVTITRDANLGAAEGGLTLDGGGLRIEGASLTALDRALTVGKAGGMLDIAQAGHTVVVPGAIGGAGSLRTEGMGAVVMTGDNTYTGPTVVANAGGLTLGDGGASGSLAGDVWVGTSLSFARSDTVDYSGAISGKGSLVKQGANLLTLTGEGMGFTGATLVQAGTLNVGRAGVGSLGGSVDVADGATLGGSGTVGSAGSLVTIRPGGIVAPGNSVGTLTVAGDLTLEPGSFFDVEADDQGQSDKLHVEGTASLAGTVRVQAQGTQFVARTPYTILSAGERVGAFQGATSNYEYLTPELAYEEGVVTLTLVRKTGPTPGPTPDPGPGPGPAPTPERPFRDAAQTPNQAAVADAVESLSRDNPLYRHVETLQQGRAAQVLNVLSAALHAGAQGAVMSAAQHVQTRSLNHLRRNVAARMLPGAPTASAMSDLPPPASSLPRADTSPLWVDIVGARRTLSGDANGVGLRNRLGGLMIGGNVRLGSGWHVGASAGYTESSVRIGERLSKADVNSVSFALTGGKSLALSGGKLNLMGGSSYAWDRFESRRDLADGGLPQVLRAKYRGDTLQVFGEASYDLQMSADTTASPFLSGVWQQYRTDAYKESGGFAAVSGRSQQARTTTGTLGLRVHKALDSARWKGGVHAMAGWRHAMGDVSPKATLAFEGSRDFAVQGAPVARNAAVLEAGAEVALAKGVALGATYTGQFGRGDREHAGKLSLRMKF